jgi:hypothetical protein
MEAFNFERPKAVFDAAFVEIDITDWLETETIDTVTFSAVDSDGVDATATVIDDGLSGFNGALVLPYIKGGVDGERYNVLCQVETVEGNYQEFRLIFTVREAP